MGHLSGIQYLRAAATVTVVAYHMSNQVARLGWDGWWLPKMGGVIDLFFVISGFIMVAVTHARPIAPFTFWWRRLVRLAPLYWVITSVMLAVLLVMPSVAATSRLDLGHVLASYAFVPMRHPSAPEMAPLLMPGWTLNYEAFFYTIFGIALLAPRRFALWGTAAVFLALWLGGVAFRPEKLSVIGFYASGIALDIALGVALGTLVTRHGLLDRLSLPVAWVLTVGGLIATWCAPGDAGAWLHASLGAVALVAGIVAVEAHGRLPTWPRFEAIGTASYSIYLTHTLVLAAWMIVWVRLGQASVAGFAVTAMLVCLLVGWACYAGLEKPLIHLFRPRRSGVRIAQPAAQKALSPSDVPGTKPSADGVTSR